MSPDTGAIDPKRSIGPPENGKRNTIVGSASLTVVWRLLDRVISLVSTPILARLLTPEDFGLVAMAALAAGLITVFLELGVGSALIQQRDPTPEHYDAAFTLRLIQAFMVGVIIIGISWPAAAYFDDPRLVPLIQVVGLTSVIAGLENIGMVLLQKHFEFRREFTFFLVRRICSLAITISLAFLLRSYWAMVLGAVAAQVVSVILSYALQSFRPRISLARVKDILSFSQWVIVRGIGTYISGALPSLFLGRYAGPAALGIYRGGAELAGLAAGEILAPLARVLYPALVEARASAEAFRQAVTLALSVQFMFTMPACVGIALVAEEVVAVLLGPKWGAAAPVLQLVALGSAFVVFHHTGGYALMAAGKVKVQAIMTWIEAALFAVLALILIASITPTRVAEVRLISTTCISWIYAMLLNRAPTAVPWSRLLGCLARPFLSCIAMALVFNASLPWPQGSPVQALLFKIAVGAITYIASVLLLWVIAGRPAGAERYLAGKAPMKLKALLRRMLRRRFIG